MQDTILAISGKPGLYRLVSRGRGMLIVESIDANKKRMPLSQRDRVTSLNDVSMYTEEDDMPLMDIFQSIYNKVQEGLEVINHKTADKAQLTAFMEAAVPNYDRDRVHDSDIKKLAQWYNILAAAGYTQFSEPETENAEEQEA